MLELKKVSIFAVKIKYIKEMSRHSNIKLSSHNKRGCLVDLFRRYLARTEECERLSYGHRCGFDLDELSPEDIELFRRFYGYDCFWDGDYDDDDTDFIYSKSKSNAKGSKSHCNRSSVYDYSSGRFKGGSHKDNGKSKSSSRTSKNSAIQLDVFGDDEYIIYFYDDYHEKYDYTEFNSYREFVDFCGTEGIRIPIDIGTDIKNRVVSHCCINPEMRELGYLELLSESSYGSMFYSACSNNELGLL